MTEPANQGDTPKTDRAYSYKYEGTDALQSLSEQQQSLGRALERVTEEQAATSYEPGKWTIKQLLGRMIDTERIMSYRALALARGEKQPLPGFDENAYVENANFNSLPLSQLLIQYHAQRTATIHLFASFPQEIFDRKGVANNEERTVRDIMRTIAAHELHHLNLLRDRYLSLFQ